MQKWLFLIIFLLNACSDVSGTRYIKPNIKQTESGQPALHAIESAQLRELMNRMDILMQESFMTEYEIDIQRRKYAMRIAATAEELSKTVKAIIDVLPSLKLSSEEQKVFLSLAKNLDDRAQLLHKQAKQNQIDAINNTMKQIGATCTSCHSLFRKFNK